MRFVVKDLYDYDETLVETDDLNIAYAAALRRIADTDGECSVVIRDMGTEPLPEYCSISIGFWGEEEENEDE